MASPRAAPIHRKDTGSASRSGHRSRIGIALAGGGPLGAVYEIGALAAIEESIEGLDLNDADIYVGISAGGIVAAGLANGITPHQMCRMFVESDHRDLAGERVQPELFFTPAWGEWGKRAASLPPLLARSAFDYLRRGGKNSVVHSFERLKRALPIGLFASSGIDEFLQKAFAETGRSNDFRQLQRRLVIVATDLDSGASVEFGQPGLDHVPISQAVQASTAVPGLFPPVAIDGRHFVDGALKKTLHASIALKDGADLTICLNPLVPYNSNTLGGDSVAEHGLFAVLSQTLRTIIHSRLEIGIGNYARLYPEADVLLFEPSSSDAEIFFANLFSYSNRRRLCENAYQHTRLTLWQQRATLAPQLARHGLRLKLPLLQDTSLTLVKTPGRRRKDRFALGRLNQTLSDLERYLKVAGS
ncbi:MAG TPA: patatin-like phospholipase family protein [Burkholderiaceae bacterium]|nr:patatin-like phospholipase family protein [Burkholderiaceae bacterium]